jgi:outer membrane biosynthesis protein TonB
VPVAGPSRIRKALLMGAGATVAMGLGLALIVGLKPPGGAKANASVAMTPPAAPAPEAVQLAAVVPVAAAPREAPPPPADTARATPPRETPPPPTETADAEPEPAPRRHAVRGKRKSSVAHHGKRHAQRETRAAKTTKQRKLAAATATTTKSTKASIVRGDPRPTYERGNALLFAGDVTGAIAAYKDAIRDDPFDPIGYRGLGLACEQKGDTTAALRALKKYLKLAPAAADRAMISRRIERLSNRGASTE